MQEIKTIVYEHGKSKYFLIRYDSKGGSRRIRLRFWSLLPLVLFVGVKKW